MLSQRGRLPCVPRGMGPALNVSRCPSELVAVQRSPGRPNATSKAEGTEPPKVSTVSKPPIAARVAGSGQHLGFWQEQSAHRLLSFMAFKLPTWSFQHVASKNFLALSLVAALALSSGALAQGGGGGGAGGAGSGAGGASGAAGTKGNSSGSISGPSGNSVAQPPRRSKQSQLATPRLNPPAARAKIASIPRGRESTNTRP